MPAKSRGMPSLPARADESRTDSRVHVPSQDSSVAWTLRPQQHGTPGQRVVERIAERVCLSEECNVTAPPVAALNA